MESELNMDCFICKEEKSLVMLSRVDEIPYFGEHTQVTVKCNSCGWRQTDFIPAEGKKSGLCSIVIDNAEFLSTRVVRSSSCTIKIPELDLEVYPGSDSTGFVSNIEGVLNRFDGIVNMVLKQLMREEDVDPNSLAECIRIKEKLASWIRGEISENFTIEFYDPRGHSQILHENTTQRELTQKELDELPTGTPAPVISNDEIDHKN